MSESERTLSATPYPERIVPDDTAPGIVAIHLKRYEFARPYCVDADVLDAACGVGYGTAHVGKVARRVVGIDRSEKAVAYARDRYAAPNVEFMVGDVLALDLPGASFDAVCSFETIEHVRDQERFLAEVARVLRPRGVLVVSTPRVAATTRSPDNPYHAVELSREDFETLLQAVFDHVELYGQRRLQTGRHRAMQRLDVLDLRKRFGWLRRGSVVLGTPTMAEVTADGLAIDREDLGRATELIAVCREPRS